MIARGVDLETGKTREVLRQIEAHWHAPQYESEAFALVRGLEVALEQGYRRLLFRSAYCESGPRPERHPRYLFWEPSVALRFSELVSQFAWIQFGAPPASGNAARQLARRARSHAASRPPRHPTHQGEPGTIAAGAADEPETGDLFGVEDDELPGYERSEDEEVPF